MEKWRWDGRFWRGQSATMGGFFELGFFQGAHGCARDLRELLTDGFGVTQSGLKNGSRGAGMMDKPLHETIEWSDTGLPGNTSGGVTVERWRRRREWRRFDSGGRRRRGELLHRRGELLRRTLYCRVPNTPNQLP